MCESITAWSLDLQNHSAALVTSDTLNNVSVPLGNYFYWYKYSRRSKN